MDARLDCIRTDNHIQREGRISLVACLKSNSSVHTVNQAGARRAPTMRVFRIRLRQPATRHVS
eukprot:6191337-Pleurochrysis_carterae.AAC.1